MYLGRIKSDATPDKALLAEAALQAFFGITEDWALDSRQQNILLGNLPKSTFYHLRKNKKGLVSDDILERISYIMGIQKALIILEGNDAQAIRRWLHATNNAPLFNGNSALHKMLSGHVSDLYEVRRFLDAWRG